MMFCIRTRRLLGCKHCKHEQKASLLALTLLVFCLTLPVSIFGARLPGELQQLCKTLLHRWGLFATKADRCAIDLNQNTPKSLQKTLHNVRTLRTQFEIPQSYSSDTILQRRTHYLCYLCLWQNLSCFGTGEQCGEGNSFGLHFQST